MEMARPPIHRTYGKASKLGPSSSSSSIIFDLEIPFSSPSLGQSSSPPSSSPPLTPDHPCAGSYEPAVDNEEDEDEGPLFPERQVLQSVTKGVKRKGSTDVLMDVKQRNLPATGKAGMKSGQSSLRGFFTSLPKSKPKEPLLPAQTIPSIQSLSQPAVSSSSSTKAIYTQSHLTHLPLLHTCQECAMSYVRSSPTDEVLHRRHHARVIRGIMWDGLGKGKGKAVERGRSDGDCGWRVVSEGVRFGARADGVGRVVVCDGSFGGMKLEDIHSTVDTVLSAPPLPQAILERTKTFLFLTSSPPPTVSTKRPKLSSRLISDKESARERIVAVVVAQGIKWGMRVLKSGETLDGVKGVDSGGGVICDPARLDTPLGIHRLFTVPAYRSLGLAQILLDAAAENTVYGCTFNPRKGEVAFSQPTESGRAVMEKWGKGEVRVFVDDESQL